VERDPLPKPGTEAWFKELENRLASLGGRLSDAATKIARSMQVRAEIGDQLADIQDMVERIESRVSRLSQESGDRLSHENRREPNYLEVPGFPGYRVGEDGSVWGSRSAGRGYGRTRDWRRLKPYLVRPGPTPTVSLYRDRIRHPVPVGAMVLLAFVGPCPDGCAIEHLNGDALDNRLDNLRYVASE